MKKTGTWTAPIENDGDEALKIFDAAKKEGNTKKTAAPKKSAASKPAKKASEKKAVAKPKPTKKVTPKAKDKPKASTPASKKAATAKKVAPKKTSLIKEAGKLVVKKQAAKDKSKPKTKAVTTATAAPKKTGRPTTIPDKSRETVDLTHPIMKCIANLHPGQEKFNSPYIRKAVIAQLKKDGFKPGVDFVEC